MYAITDKCNTINGNGNLLKNVQISCSTQVDKYSETNGGIFEHLLQYFKHEMKLLDEC